MLLNKLKTLDASAVAPANFGLVMATGIISIAAHFLNVQWLARFLFDVNIVFFVVLWVLTIVVIINDYKSFVGQLSDYLGGPGFFSVVAATNVLGSQFVILDGDYTLASYLWMFSCILWVILTYVFFTAITIQPQKPTLETGLNGSWLLIVVATQSVTVLGSFLIHQNALFNAAFLEFFILIMWFAGAALYFLIMTMIFYRYLFRDFAPKDLSPSYWINMGGMAISTLAGARLIVISPESELLLSMLPFLKGLTLFFWSAGTWWIPFLILLEIWRQIYKHYPINYNPIYWGLIFPLGMYAASTYEIIEIFDLGFIRSVPHVFLYAAAILWLATCGGLIHKILKSISVSIRK
ncbi:tellurite resistance/C4-dicarboxylate transporter family protein [Orrella sp. 11846]|uniref:tellurite resistance/C4-dicarboxylate transporter family protein n=1 Tax=Orrella sp. 11846 TaxID=3409913 RepID=UPI003B596489